MDENGELTATATCDAWRDSVAVRDRVIRRLRMEMRLVEVEVKVPTPLAWYDRAARWVAGLSLGSLALAAAAAGIYQRFKRS